MAGKTGNRNKKIRDTHRLWTAKWAKSMKWKSNYEEGLGMKQGGSGKIPWSPRAKKRKGL